MTNFEEVLQYCKDIKNKKIVSNKWTKKAVEKFLSELKNRKMKTFLIILMKLLLTKL